MPDPAAAQHTAAELVRLVQQGRPAEFGTRYGQVLDDPDGDEVTQQLVALLTAVARDWFEESADGAEVIRVVHERLAEAYPRTLELVGVNLVILEHTVRSVLAHSDFLGGLDGSLVCLYCALLLGSLLVTEYQLDSYLERAGV